jgi:membrane protease YdiL (CAAX protease family)
VKSTAIQAIVLRAGLFVLFVILGSMLFPWMLVGLFGYFGGAALTTFCTGFVANLLSLSIYEHLPVVDAGLRWNRDASRNLLLGLGAGAGAALFVIGGMVLSGSAQFVASGNFNAGSFTFVTVLLMAGAAGEELMFRGYAFQYVAPRLGVWTTMLPVGVLFGFAHAGNKNATLLSLINTIAWGILLGYAFLRSHDLWLPMGIHFAWNWTLSMLGANLSGFSMQGVTGLALKPDLKAPLSGGEYGPEGSILATVVVFGVVWLLHKGPVVTRECALLDRGFAEQEAEDAARIAEAFEKRRREDSGQGPA